MLTDRRLSKLVDFENFSEVFPGVDLAGGVCYFLWEKDYLGPCEIVNSQDGEITKTKRELNEFEIFIRNNLAVPIIKKVAEKENPKHYLNKVISSSKPFGIRGFYKPKKTGVPCHFAQRIGLEYAAREDITDRFKFLEKWKLLIPKSPIAGQTDFSKPVGFYYDGNTRIAKPGECCTETYLVAFASKFKEEVESFKSYLFTKIARFLLLQAVVSQDITREKFMFVPHLDRYDKVYTDDILRERWGITDDEWEFIDSKIRNI